MTRNSANLLTLANVVDAVEDIIREQQLSIAHKENRSERKQATRHNQHSLNYDVRHMLGRSCAAMEIDKEVIAAACSNVTRSATNTVDGAIHPHQPNGADASKFGMHEKRLVGRTANGERPKCRGEQVPPRLKTHTILNLGREVVRAKDDSRHKIASIGTRVAQPPDFCHTNSRNCSGWGPLSKRNRTALDEV
jgi:hypothetical protein